MTSSAQMTLAEAASDRIQALLDRLIELEAEAANTIAIEELLYAVQPA